MLNQFPILIPVIVYPVYVLDVSVKLVEAQLEAHVLKNEQAGRHPDGEPGDVDERKSFILHQFPPRDFEIAYQHY